MNDARIVGALILGYRQKWKVLKGEKIMILVTGANGFVGNKIMQLCKDTLACPSLREATEDEIKRIVEESGVDVIFKRKGMHDNTALRICNMGKYTENT